MKLEILQLIIEQEIYLAELECLGLEERTINALEKAGIQTVKDVVEQWCKVKKGIRNIGPAAIKQIICALSNIHLLEEKSIEYTKHLMPNYDSAANRDSLYHWNK